MAHCNRSLVWALLLTTSLAAPGCEQRPAVLGDASTRDLGRSIRGGIGDGSSDLVGDDADHQGDGASGGAGARGVGGAAGATGAGGALSGAGGVRGVAGAGGSSPTGAGGAALPPGDAGIDAPRLASCPGNPSNRECQNRDAFCAATGDPSAHLCFCGDQQIWICPDATGDAAPPVCPPGAAGADCPRRDATCAQPAGRLCFCSHDRVWACVP